MQQEIPSQSFILLGVWREATMYRGLQTVERCWMNTCFNVNVFLWQTVLLVIHDIDTNDSRQKVVMEGHPPLHCPACPWLACHKNALRRGVALNDLRL